MIRLRWRRRAGILTTVLLVSIVVGAPVQAADDEVSTPTGKTEAVYGDRIIDMAKDWESAEACLVWPEVVDMPECFDSEEEMDRRIAELEKMMGSSFDEADLDGGRAVATSCSGYLSLYDGTSYGGASLYLRGQGEWFDLATFNFNQKTSSFKIGPCSAYFADLAGGQGAWYPTAETQAYDVAPTMATGWNNDVSSVYIK
jgi:hypothetical protein